MIFFILKEISNMLKNKNYKILSALGTTIFLVVIYITQDSIANTAHKVEKAVKQSINTRQKTQKNIEKWESQKTKLSYQYDQLLKENKALKATQLMLSEEEIKYKELNKSLKQQKLENLRIQKEMLPFLQSVLTRLEILVNNDAPFLKNERNVRLLKLKAIINDIDISIAEKYRKTMEALSIETEYGNTIEVYQDKIKLGNNKMMGNIFRLGRVSIFFLSLDKNSVAVFNVAENQWQFLDDIYIPVIEEAVEMASKRQPVKLISLPLGKIGRTAIRPYRRTNKI